ncbi:MAG: Antibiotic biosynthesis monooxygenase [Solirubrobacterales bacterium]|jgi:quinol monooxygenase YgiN|nr:Antibiotic biosynthesis monooxygenase [Solirubrobacterales bacterium]
MSAPFVVSARWRAKKGSEGRLQEICEEMATFSRREEGNLFYQAHRSPDDPQLFCFYEQYVDEAAFQAHVESEYFVRLVKSEAIPQLLESRERELLEAI